MGAFQMPLTGQIIKAELFVDRNVFFIDVKYEPTKYDNGRIQVDINVPIKIWKKGNELTKWIASKFDL